MLGALLDGGAGSEVVAEAVDVVSGANCVVDIPVDHDGDGRRSIDRCNIEGRKLCHDL